MKRKTIFSAVALLLVAGIFSGCTGCGGNSKVSFEEYWKYDVSTAQSNILEELSYKMSFEAGSGMPNYSVDYKTEKDNAVYKTTLSSQSDKDGNVIYTYKTEWSVEVVYSLGSLSSESLLNTLTSEVTFYSSKNGFQPISSTKHGVSHSPLNQQAQTIEECYKKHDRTITTTYAADGKSGETKIVDNIKKADTENYPNESDYTQTSSFTIDNENYSYLDNEQLLLGLRAVNPSLTTSPTFLVYAPFSVVNQRIGATYATATTDDFNLSIDGGDTTKYSITYYPVTFSIKLSNFTGSKQTAWIAKTTNAKANEYRNAILRYEVPVDYNLGTLVYQLKTANFAATADKT